MCVCVEEAEEGWKRKNLIYQTTPKGMVKKMTRQSTDWEETFRKFLSDKVASRI